MTKKGIDRDRDRLYEMPDDEIIGLADSDFSTSSKWRDTVNVKNQRLRDHYFQKETVPKVSAQQDEKAKSEGRSHIYVGLIRAFVDTALSIICDTIYSQEQFIKIEPTEEGDESASEQFESLLHYRLGRSQMDFRRYLKEEWVFQALLYDFSVARFGWTVERGWIPQQTIIDKILNLALFRYFRKYKETVMIPKMDAVDRPDMEVLNTLLCYPDEQSTDFGGNNPSRYFIYLQETNRSALRKKEKTKENPYGIYQNVDKIEPNSYPGLKADQQTKDKTDTEKPSESDLIQFKNYYTSEAMVVIANNKWVVRRKRIAGFPFSKMTLTQPNHSWSGIGLVEGIEMLQLDVNQMVRMRRNNQSFIIEAVAVVNEALFAHKTNQDYRMHPGKTFAIRFGDPSKAIHFARPPDVTQTLTQEINFEVGMMERISGVSENVQGVWRVGGRRTATEADQVQQGTSLRFGEIIRSIEQKNITDAVYQIYNLEQLNLTEEVKFRILGKEGAEYKIIGKENIFHNGAFDVRPIGSRYETNRTIKTNQFLQAVGIVGQNPAFAQMSDMKEVLKQIWVRLGEKDPERFILDDSRTDYKIPPEIENTAFLAKGQQIEPGNRDDDGEHIAVHEQFIQQNATNFPVENLPLFEEHIQMHQQRLEALQQGKGQGQLPQTPGNVLAQPFQTFGGRRTPEGGGMEGTPSPQEPVEAPPT